MMLEIAEITFLQGATNARIGVVADTHIPGRAKALPPALLQGLRGCDVILHAGDVNDPAVLDVLGTLAPVVAVAGNTDGLEQHIAWGRAKVVTVAGCRIGLIHGDGVSGTTQGRALAAFKGAGVRCVVFGHSHVPVQEEVHGVLCLNPGSPTDKRRQPYPTYARVQIVAGAPRPELIRLS